MKPAIFAVLTSIVGVSLLCCGSNAAVSLPPAAGHPEGGVVGGDSGGDAACPSVDTPIVAGTVDEPEVNETSGIVASAVNDGVYWVHNDSGDTARAFALNNHGKLLATLAFDTVKPRDIEDVAIEDDSAGRSFLYFGDIGDNQEHRTEVTIHRVAEPKLTGGTAQLTVVSEKMTVIYPDGPHNAETLLFDPSTKDLLIATKKAGGPSAIHRVGRFAAGTKVTTEKIATVDIDLATGGEISRDGRLVAIRNYSTSVFVWVRAPGEGVAAALSRPPCTLPLASEKQGEAFAFLTGGKGYVTISEGGSPELHVSFFQ
jgi:hypothetical protein